LTVGLFTPNGIRNVESWCSLNQLPKNF
jgi:hypothetical protein